MTDFILNDKCAAGTGSFIEVIAEALNLPLGVSNKGCQRHSPGRRAPVGLK